MGVLLFHAKRRPIPTSLARPALGGSSPQNAVALVSRIQSAASREVFDCLSAYEVPSFCLPLFLTRISAPKSFSRAHPFFCGGSCCAGPARRRYPIRPRARKHPTVLPSLRSTSARSRLKGSCSSMGIDWYETARAWRRS
jgi:hypothetical protein